MPNPHFGITITQWSIGQSAVASAAYQSGEKLFSEYDQKTKNYSGKCGILYTEIVLPVHALPELYPQMFRDYCEKSFVFRGRIADFPFLDLDPSGYSGHCYMMLTLRAMDKHSICF